MKRILAVLLSLVLMFSITACKPDNITYPTEIVDPVTEEETQTPETEGDAQTPAAGEETAEEDSTVTEDPKTTESTDTEEPQPEEPVENTSATAEDTETPAETDETESGEEVESSTNPLAAADFKPATGTASTLSTSGLIKPGSAISALKNRTITLYTAGSTPAFSYVDENGATISEWDWMTKLAAENGFILKYSIKSEAVSVKAQRIALYAGKKLSLVQMSADDLAAGMTLAGSAAAHLDSAAQTFGISKAVLEQSNYKLFSPVGNAQSLWYNTALMPEDTDPQALSQANTWTVEQFKTLCSGVSEKNAVPLIMENDLVWATLSGKSPLTLLDGKLDSNINARATRDVWSAIKELDLKALKNVEGISDATLGNGTAAFEYTAAPKTAEGVTLKYAPLPALTEGTAGSVTFTGTFLALPKYETNEEAIHAALTFAELWCNRYTEVRAAALQQLGITGADYQAYCDMTEANGQLILWDTAIQQTVATYLTGLTDPAVDMDAAYAEVSDKVNGLIAARNIYY